MAWIYLSPHPDDVALSCGGLISQQTLTGEQVEIWTVCAGDPPPGPFSAFAEELHARWQTGREATASRRQEDLASCARLSASCRHLPIPDCIYRRGGLDYWRQADPSDLQSNHEQADFLYPDREAIFGGLHPLEDVLVRQLAHRLGEFLPGMAELVCPMGLGGHVDHQLTFAAAEFLGRPLWYYADYPYAVQPGIEIAALEANGWRKQQFPISPAAMEAWIQAVAAHKSQISTFWPDFSAMQTALQAYHDLFNGAVLWKKA
jgi:LmbE family N-acetylglucosaminyl deacetylase